MAQFRIFFVGGMEPQLVELPASTLPEVYALAAERRFLLAELVDVVDGDGICTNRGALIPLSRIQMVIEESA